MGINKDKSLHKKMKFSIKDFLINLAKSAVN